MNNIKLIYFKDCPNYEAAKNLLLRVDCDFEEINQSELPEYHLLKHYTSPTILKNEKIIIGEKIDSLIGGCSIRLPSAAELKMDLAL